jgi:hypothetical protein
MPILGMPTDRKEQLVGYIDAQGRPELAAHPDLVRDAAAWRIEPAQLPIAESADTTAADDENAAASSQQPRTTSST